MYDISAGHQLADMVCQLMEWIRIYLLYYRVQHLLNFTMMNVGILLKFCKYYFEYILYSNKTTFIHRTLCEKFDIYI